MRTATPFRVQLLLSAALAAAPTLAAVPTPAPAAAATPRLLEKGDVVEVDLSRIPSRVERRGSAACVGTRTTAVDTPEEVRCQPSFSIDASVAGDPLVLVFQPKDGGRPTRLEYPLERDPRLKRFVAPAAGTLSQPPAVQPRATGAKPTMPAEQVERARTAAAAACAECRGAPRFALKDFTVEAVPPSALEVLVTVRPAAGAP